MDYLLDFALGLPPGLPLDVCEHIEDDVAAMKTLAGLLKPGGKLILTVPALMCMWSYNDVLNHHFRRYRKGELAQKLEEAGFHIVKLSYYNCYLFLPAFIVRMWKNLLKIRTSDISETARDAWMNRLLTRLFASERYHLRKGSFPIGVSLITICEVPKEKLNTGD